MDTKFSRLIATAPLLWMFGCPAQGDSADKAPPADETWPTEAPVDPDGDGWTAADGDCDDADATIHPAQGETCNGVDDNCDGWVDEGLPDHDGDETPDCLDTETCDGLDNDGDGVVDEDAPDTDADGVADCVDLETCDGLDNDGNGVVDDAQDGDGDGATVCDDCDDETPSVHPGAEEADNGVDDDCDGLVDDGRYTEGVLRITELQINPAAHADADGEWVELLNTGTRTLDLLGLTLVTEDGSEIVTASGPVEVEPGAYIVLGSSVLDGENGHVDVTWAWASVSLANEGGTFGLYAGEVRIDEVSWDGAEIESGASWMLDGAWLTDGIEAWCPAVTDLDGIPGDLGTPGAANELCFSRDHDGDGVSPADGDCDDADPSLAPGLPETWYDGIDADCLGDDDFDQDHDGAALEDDCDDTDAAAHPGATEVCDEADVDEDCNGVADDADTVPSPLTWYPDADLDGYGDDAAPWIGCDAPDGHTLSPGDCDDGRSDVSPSATETCGDGRDNDCDGTPNACGWAGEIADADTLSDLHLVAAARGESAGTSLTFAGDGDTDGITDLVVGAPGNDRAGLDAGGIYVVPADTSGEGALSDAGSAYEADDARDAFGTALLGNLDFDGDGAADVLVGAPGDDAGTLDGGAVYVLPDEFGGSGTPAAAASALLIAEDAGIGLGTALASAGDTDGDGAWELAVSAPLASDSFAGAGDVYLFEGPFTDTHRAGEALAIFTGVTASDAVGDSLAGGVDVDGDGIADLAIGGKTAGSTRPTGEAYVVSADTLGTVSLTDATATITGATANGETGASVALLGDEDGDGYGDLLVGSPSDNGGGAALGAASLFRGPVTGALKTTDADATFTGEFSDGEMGRVVTDAGDLDADGRSDFAIGSPNWNNAGAVYLFYGGTWSGTLSGGTASARFLASNTNTQFGAAILGGVDVTGDALPDLIVGAPGDQSAGRDAGAIFVFGGGPGY